jgi:hypothetical protein
MHFAKSQIPPPLPARISRIQCHSQAECACIDCRCSAVSQSKTSITFRIHTLYPDSWDFGPFAMLRAVPMASGGTMLSHRLVSPTTPAAARLQPCVRAFQPCRRRSGVCVRAAMAGAADGGFSDPYQVQQLHFGCTSSLHGFDGSHHPNMCNAAKSRSRSLEDTAVMACVRTCCMHAGMHADPSDVVACPHSQNHSTTLLTLKLAHGFTGAGGVAGCQP